MRSISPNQCNVDQEEEYEESHGNVVPGNVMRFVENNSIIINAEK